MAPPPNPVQKAVQDVRYIKQSVPASDLQHRRNLCALQGALLRGDRQITLHNLDTPSSRMVSRIRLLMPGDDHWKSIHIPWSWYFDPNKPRQSRYQNDIAEVEKKLGGSFPTHYSGFALQWLKVVGKGGNGWAVLCEAEFEDGSKQLVVVKVGIPGASNDFAFEAAWHHHYRGSEHTVQVVDLQAIALKKSAEVLSRTNGAGPLRFTNGPIFNPRALNVVVLEYAPYGDMFSVLGKAYANKMQFSKRVLWEIWECLVRGVFACAYQSGGNDVEGFLNLVEKHSAWELLLDDFCDRRMDSHHFHSDLEESNILVGSGMGTRNHRPFQPIFKFHDFGKYSFDMRAVWEATEEEKTEKDYWTIRDMPKVVRFTPEQVTRDWDEFQTNDPQGWSKFVGEDLSRGTMVAGRYGTWSNIFIIGRIMEGVITGRRSSQPFRPVVTSDGYSNSYAKELLEGYYQNICEEELLSEVIRCQFHRPQDRPSPKDLLKTCIERRKTGGFQDNDFEVDVFWNKLLKPSPQTSSSGSTARGPARRSSGGSSSSPAGGSPGRPARRPSAGPTGGAAGGAAGAAAAGGATGGATGGPGGLPAGGTQVRAAAQGSTSLKGRANQGGSQVPSNPDRYAKAGVSLVMPNPATANPPGSGPMSLDPTSDDTALDPPPSLLHESGSEMNTSSDSSILAQRRIVSGPALDSAARRARNGAGIRKSQSSQREASRHQRRRGQTASNLGDLLRSNQNVPLQDLVNQILVLGGNQQ